MWTNPGRNFHLNSGNIGKSGRKLTAINFDSTCNTRAFRFMTFRITASTSDTRILGPVIDSSKLNRGSSRSESKSCWIYVAHSAQSSAGSRMNLPLALRSVIDPRDLNLGVEELYRTASDRDSYKNLIERNLWCSPKLGVEYGTLEEEPRFNIDSGSDIDLARFNLGQVKSIHHIKHQPVFFLGSVSDQHRCRKNSTREHWPSLIAQAQTEGISADLVQIDCALCLVPVRLSPRLPYNQCFCLWSKMEPCISDYAGPSFEIMALLYVADDYSKWPLSTRSPNRSLSISCHSHSLHR